MHRLCGPQDELEPPGNHERVLRIMRQNCMLLARHTGRRTGRVTTVWSWCSLDLGWCSDGFEISCWNSDIIRIVFIIHAHDREIIARHAVVGSGISGGMVRDMIGGPSRSDSAASSRPRRSNGRQTVAAPTRPRGRATSSQRSTSWHASRLSKAGSGTVYRRASSKPSVATMFAVPMRTLRSGKLAGWFEDYNENHPHSGLKMRSPRRSSEHKRNSRPSDQLGATPENDDMANFSPDA